MREFGTTSQTNIDTVTRKIRLEIRKHGTRDDTIGRTFEYMDLQTFLIGNRLK